MAFVVSGVVGAIGGALTFGGIAGAALGAGLSIGASALQRRQQQKAQSAALAAQKKAEKKARRQALLDARRARREARRNQGHLELKAPINLTSTIRNSVEPRRIIYGRARVGGIWVYAESAGTGNNALLMIFALGEGPCNAVETFYADADIPTVDDVGDGTGAYANDIVVRSHLGDIYDSDERTFTSDHTTDEITITTDTAIALAVGDMVTFRTTGTLPAGLGSKEQYFIKSKSSLTYTLSSTLALDKYTPGSLTNITDNGSGTHYLTRSASDIMCSYQCQNWKPKEHKMLGICYVTILVRASGGQWGSVPEISCVVRGKKDVLDPRQAFTVEAIDVLSTHLYLDAGDAADRLVAGQVVAIYGTKNDDGLVTGGIEYGRKYYVYSAGGTQIKLTERYGLDAMTFDTSIDTGQITVVPAWYDTNAALCLANYLSDPIRGVNLDWWAEIDQDQLSTAADICDQTIETLDSQAAAHTFVSGDVTTGSSASIEITGHGLQPGQAIRVASDNTLPAGLSADTDYFVEVIDEDNISLKLYPNYHILVAMTDGGTGNHSIYLWERRYVVDGAIDMSQSPEDIISEFKLAMGSADVIFYAGKFYFYPGAYSVPSFTITEDMIIGEVEYSNISSRRDRINEVGGVYMSEENAWQPFDFPVVSNTTYRTNDGEKLRADLQLPFTKSPAAAQRLAKIVMEQSRMTKRLSLVCNLRAFPALTANTVMVTIPRYNFSSKVFRVEKISYSGQAGEDIDLALELLEWESAIFDWDYSTDEVEINVAASILNAGKKVDDVESDPAAGSGHSFPLSITLSCATDGAAIRYTVNGTTPATVASGTEYTASFNVSDGDTVRARAFLSGFQDSDEFLGTYTS